MKVALSFVFSIMLGSLPVSAAVEFQSHFLPSFALSGKADLVLSTHNTLMFGDSGFFAGGYASYESISQDVTDTAFGGAIRFGDSSYVEIQGGYFKRQFSLGSIRQKGEGVESNLVYGNQLTPNFGLSVMLSGKRISSGDLDKRTIIDLLPYFTFRFGN